eukprot:g80714.t1
MSDSESVDEASKKETKDWDEYYEDKSESAMAPKKKTATEAETSESAHATAPATAHATAPSTATEAKADEKTEAKSTLASFGKKKSKSQKKPQELDKKVYVVFKKVRNNPDAIYDEAKEGRLDATWIVTAGEDEVP